MGKFYQKTIFRFLIKFLYLAFPIVLLLFNCNNNRQFNLIGNWYYCDPKSNKYNECYIQNDSTIVFNNLEVGSGTSMYKIKKDSLIIYNNNYSSSFKINPYIDGTVILENDTNIITLNKIEKNLETWKLNCGDLKTENEFIDSFYQRSLKKCIDMIN